MTVFSSVQMGADYRKYPIESHGKLRTLQFDLTIPSGGGTDPSSADLGVLPMGRIRLLPGMSRIEHSAFGAGVVLGIGHRSYTRAHQPEDGGDPVVDENLEAFATGIDISAAGSDVQIDTALKFDLYNMGGIGLACSLSGAAIPADATLSGYLIYVCE